MHSHTNHNHLFFFHFCLFQRRQDPSSCLTRPGSSPRRHSAGCTWASSAHRRHSGCSTDQELNQGDLEAGRGAVGERRNASCGAGGEEKVWGVASVHSGLLGHLCQWNSLPHLGLDAQVSFAK